MTSGAGSLVVKKLNIRGHEADAQRARRQLPDALERCSWPDTEDEEIIIIRRLQVREACDRLAEATTRQAAWLSRQAVDGDAPGAVYALVVRFRNRARLHASLIRDLLAADGANHWYWRQWQALFDQPADEAITELLCQAPLEIPAVFHQLPEETRFVLWGQLSEPQAVKIIHAIAQATGWRDILAIPGADADFSASNDMPSMTQDLMLDSVAVSAIDQARASAGKLHLAAIVQLWMSRVQLLQTPAAPRHLERLIRQSIVESVYDRSHSKLGPSSTPTSESVPDAPGIVGSQEPRPADAAPLQDVPLAPGNREDSRSERSSEAALQVVKDVEDRTDRPAATLYNEGVISQWGGIFYLLNFFNLPAIRDIMTKEDVGVSPWHWLYHLALRLNCEPDPPLLLFLSEQLGAQDAETLIESSPPQFLSQVANLGQRRYGDTLWHARTFARTARLIGDHSHLDIHFPMQAVDIDVRRYGLDINLGWLPWLGRVVHFHYGSGREPGAI